MDTYLNVSSRKKVKKKTINKNHNYNNDSNVSHTLVQHKGDKGGGVLEIS